MSNEKSQRYRIELVINVRCTEKEAVAMARAAIRNNLAEIQAIYDEQGNEIDSDPYEGSFREAADNEGSRIAAEGRGDD